MKGTPWIAGVTAALAAVGLLGLAVGRSTADDYTAPPSTGRLTQLEHSGEMHTMLQQHQDMMSQMQAGLTPQMIEIMRNDPMWRMLASGEMTGLMEEHQKDIDRMLAR